MSTTIRYPVEADTTNFKRGMAEAKEALKGASGAMEEWTTKQQRAAMRMESMHEEALKMNSAFKSASDDTQRAAESLRAFDTALGGPLAGSKALAPTLDLAGVGFKNLTTSAAGFNAVSAGVVGAGLAVGMAIGEWLRTFPAVQKAADDLAASIVNLGDDLEGLADSGGRQALTTEQAAKSGVEAIEKQIARMRELGKTNKEIVDFYQGNMNPALRTSRDVINDLAEQVKKEEEAHKKAAAAAKEHAAAEANAFERGTRAATNNYYQKQFDDAEKALTETLNKVTAKVDQESVEAISKVVNDRIMKTVGLLTEGSSQGLLWERFGRMATLIGPAQKEVAKTAKDWRVELQAVAALFTQLGGKAGGLLGNIFTGVAAIGASIKGWKEAGSGFGGFLGKIGAAGGMLGAGISIVKGIGGLLGFGGGAEKKRQQEEALAQAKESVSKMEDALKRLNEIKLEKLNAGVVGLAAMFKNAAASEDLTQERMDRLSTFGAALFEQLRRDGMTVVEAFKAMGPALDQALAAAEKSGLAITGTLGMLADFRNKVSENEDLVNAAEGLGAVFDALRSTGNLTAETFAQLQKEMGSTFDDLVAKGFTSEQALALLAPSLYQAKLASEQFGYSLDENTKKMIEQADQAGLFDNMKDPMQEMVELQQMMLQLWAAIAKVQGVDLPQSLQAYLAELDKTAQKTANVPVPGGGGGGEAPAHGGPRGGEHFDGGGYQPPGPESLNWTGSGSGEYHVPGGPDWMSRLAGELGPYLSGGGSQTLAGRLEVDLKRGLGELTAEAYSNNEGGLRQTIRRDLGLT